MSDLRYDEGYGDPLAETGRATAPEEISDEALRLAMRAAGRRGGLARAQALTAYERGEAARRAAEIRWGTYGHNKAHVRGVVRGVGLEE